MSYALSDDLFDPLIKLGLILMNIFCVFISMNVSSVVWGGVAKFYI